MAVMSIINFSNRATTRFIATRVTLVSFKDSYLFKVETLKKVIFNTTYETFAYFTKVKGLAQP
jgi:hypothetical protein